MSEVEGLPHLPIIIHRWLLGHLGQISVLKFGVKT